MRSVGELRSFQLLVFLYVPPAILPWKKSRRRRGHRRLPASPVNDVTRSHLIAAKKKHKPQSQFAQLRTQRADQRCFFPMNPELRPSLQRLKVSLCFLREFPPSCRLYSFSLQFCSQTVPPHLLLLFRHCTHGPFRVQVGLHLYRILTPCWSSRRLC